ncbi:MAG: hypothetical protein ACT4PV_11025 [Planctomycetaceae bacterium]
MSLAAVSNAPGPWICSRRWDLGWLIGSVLVVPLAPLLYAWGLSAARVAMIVMLAVGGPHVFVTFTRTNMDPRFVRKHKAYARVAYLIPLLTAAFAFLHTPLFLTVFFTWASLHVLQQICYVANCYSNRQGDPPVRGERLFEYGVVFSCLYPFATIRMVEGTFMLDGIQLLVPEAILVPGLVTASFGVFGVFLAGWLVFTVRRWRRGSLHIGKTLLISATVLATLFTPLFPNLDVAFQGINTWHCIQYLALIWWANRLRAERGEVELPFVRALSQRGWPGLARYYLAAVAGTSAVVGLILLVTHLFPLSELLAYYMVAKGLLLTHYYYDTFLFTQKDELTAPAPLPAVA